MPKRVPARRPTKNMMLAVNAAIDGDQATVDQFVKEFDLDCAELEQRLATRNGRRYEFGRKKKAKDAPQTNHAARTKAPDAAFRITIDGRTSVAKLFRIIEQADQLKAQAQQELKRRSANEVEPVKRAFAEIELLRREQAKIQEKISIAEEALG